MISKMKKHYLGLKSAVYILAKYSGLRQLDKMHYNSKKTWNKSYSPKNQA